MTIDINKLRRLAQAATPGPWYATGKLTRYVEARIDGGLIQEVAACGPTKADGGYGPQQEANASLIAAANPAAISELLDRLEEAESDALEQARLNGIGAEKELALMAKLEAAEKERDSLRAKVEAIEKEHDALLGCLNVSEWKELIKEQKMSESKYMVSVTGANAPSHIHTNWQTAKDEAERLSRLSQNRDRTIHIVEIKATLKPVTTHVWG